MNPQNPSAPPTSPIQQATSQPQNNGKIDGPTNISPDSVKFYRRFVFALVLVIITAPVGTFIYVSCTNHVYKVKDGQVSIVYFKNRKFILIILGFASFFVILRGIAAVTSS